MELTKRQRELIGRSTMLLVALLLFVGAYKLSRVAAWMDHEEQREALQRPNTASDDHQDRIAPYLWIGTAVLAGGGLLLIVFAFMPMSIMQQIVPGAPTTGENPEIPRIERIGPFM